jgi:hypothetical protein
VELNDKPEASEAFPSPEMVRVIEYLVDPDHFDRDRGPEQGPAIQTLNDILRRSEPDMTSGFPTKTQKANGKSR